MATMHPNPMHSNPMDSDGTIRIGDPGALIAAIPALLGFRPHRSLVVICLAGTPTVIRAVMRQDLPAGVLTVAERAGVEDIAVACERAGADAAIAVLVDDRPDVTDVTDDALVDCLGACLAEVGVDLLGAHATGEIVAGRPWWGALGDPACGVLPDPAASTVAAEQVLRGRQIRDCRSDLESVLAPRGRADRRGMARLLAVARHPVSRTVPYRDREALELVLGHIAARAASGPLTDANLAAVSVALENSMVRDSLLGLAVTADADAADRVWIDLARVLPGPDRAQPATLLAFGAYARGDGPLAGIALTAALDADPDHRLAVLLDRALRGGVRPEEIVALAHTGRSIAADLGVSLPPVAAA